MIHCFHKRDNALPETRRSFKSCADRAHPARSGAGIFEIRGSEQGSVPNKKLNTPPCGCGHSHTPHLVECTRDYHYPLSRCQSPVSTEIAYFFYNNRSCNCARIMLGTTLGHRVIRNVIRRTNRVRVQEVCFPAGWEQPAEIRLTASSKSRMRANSARRGRFCQSKSAGRHETPGRPGNQQDKPQ